jgi:RND family efflux transporter MFP subunit
MQTVSKNLTKALILFLLIVVLVSCSEKKVEKTVEMVKPVKTIIVGQGVAGIRTYPGTVQAADRGELSFRVGGPLISFPVKEGQKVQKGELLARIDPRDYKIVLSKAEAEYSKADADYNRYQQLYEKEAVSLADLELRQAQRDVAQSNLDNAKADLSDTYLRAPFKGEIGEKYYETGEDIQPKVPVLGLHGVDVIEIVVNVPENDKANFDPQNIKLRPIRARFAFATDQEYDLTPSEFSSSADSRTQTYKATFSMAQPEGVNIQPGMTAEVLLYPQPSEGGKAVTKFVIPAVAVFARDDEVQYVWVVEPSDMTIHRVEVETGVVTGTSDITVTAGLSAGERIVVAGVSTLRDSMRVSLMEEHFNIQGGTQ